MLKYNPVERAIALLQDKQIPEIPVSLNRELLPMVSRNAYLGDPQQYGKETASGRLTHHQIQMLARFDIEANVDDHVEKGLVTVQTENGTFDLCWLHNHITSQLFVAQTFPESSLGNDIKQLLLGINILRRGIQLAIADNPALLKTLRREQELQYSQLGTLVLPTSFLNQLKEPVRFVDTTAQRIGQLVELSL